MKASRLAKALVSKFLQEGNFVAAGGPMSLQAVPAASSRAFEQLDEEGFAGLAVQAVGYAEPDDEDSEEDEEEQEGNSAEEVHIYVSRGSQKDFRALPASIGGVRLRAHNIGKLYVKPHASLTTTNRGNIYIHDDDRVACGSSAAPSGKNYAGTYGMLVKDGDGLLYALSNNHVFADCNHLPIGMPILSPAGMDGRPGERAPGEICRFSKMIELRSGAPALVNPCREDLAIAEVTDEDQVSSWQGDEDDGYDTPAGTIAPSRRLAVKKFGRTTGLTHGTIESVVVSTGIPYQSDKFNALVWFQGVWAVKSNDSDPFALGGDSGSLVVTEDGEHCVGILFATAAKGSRGFIIPMDRVVQGFDGLEVVSDHGV
ncbi:MAG TPA: hypothetical protein VGI40_10890 [Pirellulaceae bacterium]|jgi:hypothetical protein